MQNEWFLKLGYFTLALIVLCLLTLIAYRAIKGSTEQSMIRKNTLLVMGGLGLWHLYHYILSAFGILSVIYFPPPFVTLLILPAFLFTGIFLYRNRQKKWILEIPSHWLAFYQTFRIAIETLFILSLPFGVLHPNVTLEGYNYDMLFAATAPIIGYLLYRDQIKYKTVALLWNYLGLVVIAVIIFLFQTTIFAPELYGPETPGFNPDTFYYPYALVAGFLMPSAVFIHLLSIIHLRRLRK